jgi:hypothetical protein
MFRTVLFGSELTASNAMMEGRLEVREGIVMQKIDFYKKTGAVEGGITGAGGILLALLTSLYLWGLR